MSSRWRLTLAWRGTRYIGWQRQPNGRSIQEVVEGVLERILGGERVRVEASGRTDAGVHAAAQIVTFACRTQRDARSLLGGLNGLLPPDVACLAVEPAPPGFDPRREARRKLYRYRLLNRPTRCPFREELVWHWRYDLDVEAMDAAARYMVGRYDFSSFRAQGCTARHPVRSVESTRVARVDDEVHFEFVGNGFLRHQVRIQVGTLLEVGRGRRPPASVAETLAARDRAMAGQTAPAHGLWLMWVAYDEEPTP